MSRYLVLNATPEGLQVALNQCGSNYELHSINWNQTGQYWVVIFQLRTFGNSEG